MGEAGESAAQALADHDIRRVDTLDTVRQALGDATVVVVGTPADCSPQEVRDAASAVGVPAIRLVEGDDESDRTGYIATAQPGDIGAIRNAVDMAQRVSEYHQAVDDLYEQARKRAEEAVSDDDSEIERARDRADDRLRETRDIADRIPYEMLFDPPDPVEPDETETGDEGETGNGESSETVENGEDDSKLDDTGADGD